MPMLDISRDYYFEYGKPMLEKDFADVKDRIAVGLCGEGSECLGFDDNVSLDHDVDMGFCLFITKEDGQRFGFKLERAYAKLPKEYRGYTRMRMSPIGGNRHGVIVIDDFYKRFLGTATAPTSYEQWLYLPSQALLCASNGEVFEDPLGKFSKIRDAIKNGYPEDIRLKKLSAHIVLMAQSGQYNYERCISRNEKGSAQLAVYEFVRHTISAIYLINNCYEPYYKWAFSGMRSLARLSQFEETLVKLLNEDNVSLKTEIIDKISTAIINELKAQSITKAESNDLEKHAYSVMNHIKNPNIRNLHIMDGI